MITITEDRLIQISWGALFTALGALVGFVIWLSAIHSATEANAKTLDDRGAVLQKLDSTLTSIDNRLSNIEGYLRAKEHKPIGE